MSKKVKKVWRWRVGVLFLRTRSILEGRERSSVASRGRLRFVVIFYGLLSVYMKIISWNTRELGSKKKMRIVRSFLSSQNQDIVMLQETKREIWDRRLLGSVWKGRSRK